MNKKLRAQLLRQISIAGLVALPMPAFAQQAAAPPPPAAAVAAQEVPDIIVTAQKRSQSVNTVPMSIAALPGKALANASVTSVGDIAKLVPSLTLASGARGSETLSLRGVGFNDFTLGSAPAVSTYIDQAPIPFTNMARAVGLDVERVEVLKGPQGTLFGQNSTGGAINFIANKPTQDLHYGANIAYGRFDAVDATGYISGGLSSNLRARLAVQHSSQGDWQKSYTSNRTFGSKNLTAGRLLLDFEPSPTVRFSVNLNGWIDKSDSQALQLIGIVPQVPAGDPRDNAGIAARRNALFAYPLAPANARAADRGNTFPRKHDDHYAQAVVRADIDLSPKLKLTNIFSYDDYREDYPFDSDGTTLVDADTSSSGTVRGFSNELRLAYAANGLNAVAGVTATRQTINADLDIVTDGATNSLLANGFLPVLNTPSRMHQKVRDNAAFANVDYALSEAFKIQAGARYTASRRDFAGCTTGSLADGGVRGPGLTGFITGVSAQLRAVFLNDFTTIIIQPGQCITLGPDFRPGLVTNRLSQNNVSWRVGGSWTPSRDTLVYGNVSKGYKSGSFPLLAGTVYTQFDPVVQESVLAYELGFKQTFRQAGVQVNGAVFYSDYRNKQVRGTGNDPIFGRLEQLINVPKSTIKGAEIDVRWRASQALTLSANATYIDAKIVRYIGLSDAVIPVVNDFAGARLPYTPRWQAAAEARYQVPVNARTNGFVVVNGTYNARTPTSIGGNSFAYLKGYVNLDARVGIEPSGGTGLSASVFVRNLTNEYSWSGAFVGQDTATRLANMPRRWGLSVGYRY